VDKQAMEWLRHVVDGVDDKTTDSECLTILDRRGRACTPRKLISMAKEIFDNAQTLEAFLSEFSEAFEFLHIEDGEITVVYPRCFCHHISGIPPEDVPDEYCECSRSWVQELFEQATGQSVEVAVLDSVVRGGKDCRFSVDLP